MRLSKAARLHALPLALLLLFSALPVAAQAGRSRPGGSGSSSPARVSGTASYGYGHAQHGHRRHHRYRGYHGGFYGYAGYGYGYWGWGWPYAYHGYYRIHRPPYGPYVYRYVEGDELPGAVETDVRPKKARVLVNGQTVGQARDYNGSWDLLFLEPGEHRVTFEAPGRMTLRLALSVKPGSYQRIEHRLEKGEGIDPRSVDPTAIAREEPEDLPRPAEPRSLRTGLLKLEVSPPDAVVYLDGEFLARADELGRLHGAIPLALGEHTIEAVRPGYQSASRSVRIEGGSPARVELRLEAAP